MLEKIKKAALIIWAVITSVFAVICFVLFKRKNKNSDIEEKAEHAKEKTKLEIENTPACELVDDAPNAADLQRERESITERFRSESYNAGYKQGVLAFKPEAEYWKAKAEGFETELHKAKIKYWLWGLGGVIIGFAGGMGVGIGINLRY